MYAFIFLILFFGLTLPVLAEDSAYSVFQVRKVVAGTVSVDFGKKNIKSIKDITIIFGTGSLAGKFK